MIQKILVAIDHSEMSRQVFQEACDLAKTTEARLRLLHVLGLDEENTPGLLSLLDTQNSKKRWQEFEQPGLDLLKSLALEATASGIEVESTQLLGGAARRICETAQHWDADLIVMGRRGMSGLHELFLGSVSSYVTHHAPCSVLVIQTASAPIDASAQAQSMTQKVMAL